MQHSGLSRKVQLNRSVNDLLRSKLRSHRRSKLRSQLKLRRASCRFAVEGVEVRKYSEKFSESALVVAIGVHFIAMNPGMVLSQV